MPVIAVGMITDPLQAETIIRTGQADLVALAREFLRDPTLDMASSEGPGKRIISTGSIWTGDEFRVIALQPGKWFDTKFDKARGQGDAEIMTGGQKTAAYPLLCRDCGTAGHVGSVTPVTTCPSCHSQNIRVHPELFFSNHRTY